jgi:protein-disulfide isomerase
MPTCKQATPGSFINGTTIPGAVPFEQIDSMIKPLL